MLAWLLPLLGVASVGGVVVTRPLSYIQVPNGANVSLPFDGHADKMAYDETEKYLYVIGGRTETLVIYDLNDPSDPRYEFRRTFSAVTDGVPKAIAICGQQVAIAFSDRNRLVEGHVEVFRNYQRFDRNLPFLARVATESDPVAVKYQPNCAKFVVACAGLPGKVGNSYQDPLPHIDIFQEGGDSWNKITLNFQGAQNLQDARYVFRDASNPVHNVVNDLEPSDLTIDDSGNVYVTLQENNAIAKFDIDNPSNAGIEIYSLGAKNWENSDIDTSDFDQGTNGNQITRVKRKIRGFYQPASVINFVYGASVYLATANTGAYKVYTADVEGVDFQEAQPANSFSNTELAPDMDDQLKAELRDDTMMGRLFTSHLRYPSDGWNDLFSYYDEIYAYGGRGFSIWEGSTLTQRYDSGGDFEFFLETYNSTVFNGDCTRRAETPTGTLDTRSRYMGPEPKALATGLIGSKQIVAVGSGRMGGIFLYNIAALEGGGGLPTAEFESYTRLGSALYEWGDMFDSPTPVDAGTPHINDMAIIDSSGNKFLVVLCSQLGTVAIHEMYEGSFP